MSECGKFAAFIIIFAIVSLLSWLSKKKRDEQEAEAREEFLRENGEPSPPPERPAATGLEAFLEQLAGKTVREPEAPPREEPRETPARPLAAPREARASPAEPRALPAREMAPSAPRPVERAGREARRGVSPFEQRRTEIERSIAEAKEAEAEEEAEAEAAARVRAAEGGVGRAAAAEARPEAPGLPAGALVPGRLSTGQLRRAIVMMELLGRPRALREYEPPR